MDAPWDPGSIRRRINTYPPFVGALVECPYVAADASEIRVRMPLEESNANLVGVQFGGSLYALVDPHLMLLLSARLGPDYVVWDRSAAIEFVQPGRGTVHATVRLDGRGRRAPRGPWSGRRPHRDPCRFGSAGPCRWGSVKPVVALEDIDVGPTPSPSPDRSSWSWSWSWSSFSSSSSPCRWEFPTEPRSPVTPRRLRSGQDLRRQFASRPRPSAQPVPAGGVSRPPPQPSRRFSQAPGGHLLPRLTLLPSLGNRLQLGRPHGDVASTLPVARSGQRPNLRQRTSRQPPRTTMRNEALIEGVLEVLRKALPEGWCVAPKSGAGGAPRLEVRAPDGSTGAVRLLVRSTLAPRDVRGLGEESGPTPSMVVTPYVGPTARSALEEFGFGYTDLTGNIRIRLDRPGLFVAARGADRDPRPERRVSRTLSGDKAGRVVRTLVETADPPGVRELAERTNTAAGYVSRVVRLLDREALLERDGRGKILRVAWRRLIEHWAEEAPLESRGTITTCLAARGLDAFRLRAKSAGDRVAATGTLAVSDLAPVAPTRLAILYTRDVESMLSSLELRVAERGANVWLVDPRDDWVLRGTRRVDGLTVVGVVQACADLLTSPGRGPAEGAALLDWMQANEASWRA